MNNIKITLCFSNAFLSFYTKKAALVASQERSPLLVAVATLKPEKRTKDFLIPGLLESSPK